MPAVYWALSLFFALTLTLSNALQPGDRISALSQTLHSDMKTQWVDLPLHNMPRFGVQESVVFHASLPKFHPNATDFRINPRNDVKISLTFDGNKLSIPYIPIFDAKAKKSLRKLIITFTNDEFEVIRLGYKQEYSPKINKIDPTHPALRGFEIEYRWESVQEEDFGLGVIVMFMSGVVGFLLIFIIVLCNNDFGDYEQIQLSVDRETARKSNMKY